MAVESSMPDQSLIDNVARMVGSCTTTRTRQPLVADGVELAAPHRVYYLSYGAIKRRELSDAYAVGWRFLLMQEDTAIGSAEIAELDSTVSVQLDPFAESTAQAIRDLESSAHGIEPSLDVRFLKVNSFYLRALWLVAEDRDTIVPLAPAPLFVTTGGNYTRSAFLDTLDRSGVTPFSVPRSNNAAM